MVNLDNLTDAELKPRAATHLFAYAPEQMADLREVNALMRGSERGKSLL